MPDGSCCRSCRSPAAKACNCSSVTFRLERLAWRSAIVLFQKSSRHQKRLARRLVGTTETWAGTGPIPHAQIWGFKKERQHICWLLNILVKPQNVLKDTDHISQPQNGPLWQPSGHSRWPPKLLLIWDSTAFKNQLSTGAFHLAVVSCQHHAGPIKTKNIIHITWMISLRTSQDPLDCLTTAFSMLTMWVMIIAIEPAHTLTLQLSISCWLFASSMLNPLDLIVRIIILLLATQALRFENC